MGTSARASYITDCPDGPCQDTGQDKEKMQRQWREKDDDDNNGGGGGDRGNNNGGNNGGSNDGGDESGDSSGNYCFALATFVHAMRDRDAGVLWEQEIAFAKAMWGDKPEDLEILETAMNAANDLYGGSIARSLGDYHRWLGGCQTNPAATVSEILEKFPQYQNVPPDYYL